MRKERKQDLRVIKTKMAIRHAFLELIEVNGYSKVNVTDIVEKAMINRNTFYLHYLDKEDLIDRFNEAITKENYEYAKMYKDEITRRKEEEETLW